MFFRFLIVIATNQQHLSLMFFREIIHIYANPFPVVISRTILFYLYKSPSSNFPGIPCFPGSDNCSCKQLPHLCLHLPLTSEYNLFPSLFHLAYKTSMDHFFHIFIHCINIFQFFIIRRSFRIVL